MPASAFRFEPDKLRIHPATSLFLSPLSYWWAVDEAFSWRYPTLKSEAEVLGMAALEPRRGCFRSFARVTRKRDVATVSSTVKKLQPTEGVV